MPTEAMAKDGGKAKAFVEDSATQSWFKTAVCSAQYFFNGLQRHIDHLRAIEPRVTSPTELDRDLSLHNDVLFSLLTVCQLVIDISGDLSARRGDRFEDYTEAVKNLGKDDRFPPELVEQLTRIPGFRNVLVHEYVALDLERVVEALRNLQPIDEFLAIVRDIIAPEQQG